MKFNTFAFVAATSAVCVYGDDTSSHKFQDLLTEIRMTQSDDSFARLKTVMGPVSSALGLDELFNQRRLSEGIDIMKILNIITGIYNGVNAFHVDVDAMGGNATFKNTSNHILAAYTNGLIGHMNADNQIPPKIQNLTLALEQIDNLVVDIAYTDLYNIFAVDFMNLVGSAFPLVTPIVDLITDIKNITEEIKVLMGDSPERRLIESIQDLAEETHRSLSIIDDLEGFICKLEPVLEKLVSVIEFATQVSVDKLVTDLVTLLQNMHSDAKIIKFITEIMEKAEAFLNKYGPLIHDEIVPVVEDVLAFVGKLCTPKSQSRMLIAPRMLSADIIAKIFDFLEDLVKFLLAFIQELPITLIDDLLKVVEDLAQIFLKGAKAQAVVYISEDISSIFDVLPKVLVGLEGILPVLETSVRDLIRLFDDAKDLIILIIKLVKSLI